MEPKQLVQLARQQSLAALEQVDCYNEIQLISGDRNVDIDKRFNDFLTQITQESSNLLSTGLSNVDNALGGFAKKTVNIIAGRPSMGKTTFALNMIGNLITQSKDNSKESPGVIFFSLEMSASELLTSLLASIAKVSTAEIKQGVHMAANSKKKLENSYKLLNKYNIFVYDKAYVNLATIIDQTNKISKLVPSIVAIYIDYIQLVDGNSGIDSAANRNYELSNISKGLKNLAKKLDTVVIILSQLNRKVDDRHDRRPILSDLRDSGALEQDAHSILFLYRDEMYNATQATDGVKAAEIIIAKNRHGKVGKVNVNFHGQIKKFSAPDEYVHSIDLFNESQKAVVDTFIDINDPTKEKK